jgi:hypothetical protein
VRRLHSGTKVSCRVFITNEVLVLVVATTARGNPPQYCDAGRKEYISCLQEASTLYIPANPTDKTASSSDRNSPNSHETLPMLIHSRCTVEVL